MKKITKEEIEERRRQRLERSNPKARIKRNTWGIEQSLNHSGIKIPDSGQDYFGITRDDIEDEIVRRAIYQVREIKQSIEGLSKILTDVDPGKIPLICKELGVTDDIESILSSENISDALKWTLIYNMDEVLKNET